MEVWESVWPVLAALLPSAGLLFLGWVILKHILEGDRRERAAQSRWEAEKERLRAKELSQRRTDKDRAGQ
jgi:hypothetical protein